MLATLDRDTAADPASLEALRSKFPGARHGGVQRRRPGAAGESSRVRSFDLAARVPRSWETIYDDCHYTLAGNRRVAEELGLVIGSILREQNARD